MPTGTGAPGTLWSRLLACLPQKIAVWLGLAAGITVPYFTIQRLDWLPIQAVPVLPLDHWIAFAPAWTWMYQSIDVLVPLGPALATTRAQLGRYARGLALLCVPCFITFLLFPVAGPRPEVLPDHEFYELLVAYDRPLNSMPSLHAGLVVYSLLFAGRVTRSPQPSARARALRAAGWIWGGLILYSTLATKQHWVVDLPPAMALAAAAHVWVWREMVDEGSPPACR